MDGAIRTIKKYAGGIVEVMKMKEKELQAIEILKALDKVIIVDWNMKNIYIPAIVKGLETIEKKKH